MAEQREVSGKVDAHLSGVRWVIVTLSVMFMAAALGSINDNLKRQNELKQQELEIRARQTEIMQKQYALDSLRLSRTR